MLKLSTGLRNTVLGGSSLKAALALGFIKYYSGTPPASADAAVTGTLLCTLSNASSGTGINLGTAAAGVIPKDSGEVWSGVNANSGTATYFRYVAAGDDGTLNTTTAKRLQGTIDVAGADLNMTSTGLTAGATSTLSYANIALPTY